MPSPFLLIPESQWIASNALAFAIRDAWPVSPGHTLVVPRRLIATWWEANAAERAAIWELVDEVKRRLDEGGALDAEGARPHGYNVGFNAGEAAGQTVGHLHVHVIPRYRGDVPDPRGGVRWVIPGRGNYLAVAGEGLKNCDINRDSVVREEFSDGSRLPIELLSGGDRRMLNEVRKRLGDKSFDRVDLIVSFIMRSGLELVAPALEAALERGVAVRILTTDYLNITDAHALLRLADLCEAIPGKLAVRVFHDDSTSFHPKGYLFWSSSNAASVAVVGSSNLSESALAGGIEWNVVTAASGEMRREFEKLWNDRRSRPPTREWLLAYRESRPEGDERVQFKTPRETPTAVTPHAIQAEALAALQQTRADGFRAGLVVMATGLGKTYLAAFDSNDPQRWPRVLFVAHREEILKQSRDSFRCVRPDADLGTFNGKEKAPNAEVVFASIQTLADHLDEFEPDAFDYIVIDEFHHAAARSYRRVLDHFRPSFLLGLTATPERMDGADLLALCGDNLVFDCNLVEGIKHKELCPFEYFGVRDVVDFEPIPWRNGKFDPQALTRAVETRERADQALREWRKAGGRRTLAFCCTVTHANYMKEHFRSAGVKVAAVHTGPDTDPRHDTVDAFKKGELQVLFSVDVFNEGLDVPEADSVLMLRPTESPVIFLQQLGRGLRKGRDGKVLKVVDFIGNHRSFLLKPRTLLTLGAQGSHVSPARVLEAMKKNEFELPDGCKVSYELGLVDMFKQLLRLSSGDELSLWCREVFDETGYRPSAAQAFRSGYNPGAPRAKHGGWFDFLREAKLTSDPESAVLDASGEFLRALELEPMTKSYKFVLLRALLHEGELLRGMSVAKLAKLSREMILGDPRLVRDVQTQEIPSVADASDSAWLAYWRKWPVAAWLGELKGANAEWFELKENRFAPRFTVAPDHADTFTAMVAELVEWRLARYLVDKKPIESGVVRCKLIHANGKPIIKFPEPQRAALPLGKSIPFRADGVEYLGDFVKVALNVAKKPGDAGNALVTLLRRWFGPAAGHPGTDHWVLFDKAADGWVLRPDVRENAATFTSGTPGTPGLVLPMFPDYAVACGAFATSKTKDAPLSNPADYAPLHRELRPGTIPVPSDPDLFLITARGNSMNGGPDPVRHGDLLLMRWIGKERRSELIGQVVLVAKWSGSAAAPALKRLARDGERFTLVSDHSGEPPLPADDSISIVASLVRRLDQREWNPLARHLHQQFRREDIPALYGEKYNPGNWNSGHVTLDHRIVLLTTLDKTAMSAGKQYVDRLLSPDLLEWTSQEKTTRSDKKGRGLLDALAKGTEVHLWLRRSKREGVFTYGGLVVAVSDEGEAPIRIRWRLLTEMREAMHGEPDDAEGT